MEPGQEGPTQAESPRVDVRCVLVGLAIFDAFGYAWRRIHNSTEVDTGRACLCSVDVSLTTHRSMAQSNGAPKPARIDRQLFDWNR